MMNEAQIVKAAGQTVAKGNSLVRSKNADDGFDMSAREYKLLTYLISLIKPSDTPDAVYTVDMQSFCQVCGRKRGGSVYDDAEITFQRLSDRSVYVDQIIDGRHKDVLIRWLDTVHADRARGEVDVTFHRDVAPYLFNLTGNYTSYHLHDILPMKTKYGQRLYEIARSWYEDTSKYSFDYTVDELRRMLYVDEGKYPRFSDFKRFVIDPAVDEVNAVEGSEMVIGYKLEQTKVGRAYKNNRIVFTYQYAF